MKRFIKSALIFLLLLNIGLLAAGKFYYWKAIIYQYAGIDDLKLFPYRVIQAGKPQPWPLSIKYNRIALSPALKQELTRFRTVAFLVVRDDSLLLEHYWDNYSAESFSNSFSMAKSIVGLLTGIALEEGHIKSLHQPLSDFIPEFAEPPNNKLTIYHLLTMSAELDWDESYNNLFSATTEAYYGKRLRQQMLRLKTVGEPGVRFNYQSASTQLLGMVLEKATGQPLSEYASLKLWQPIGAEQAARWSMDHKTGVEKAYCCIYSNARDFARIGKLLLDSGRWKGHPIVPEAYVLQSVRPAPLLDKGSPNRVYGFQWWIGQFNNHPYYYARGILGQYILVIPEKRLIIVRLGHQRHQDQHGQPMDVEVYIREVINMVERQTS